MEDRRTRGQEVMLLKNSIVKDRRTRGQEVMLLKEHCSER